MVKHSTLTHSAERLVKSTTAFALKLRGDVKTGRGVKLSAIGKAMQAGGGKMKDKGNNAALPLVHKRWWVAPYPKYWRFRYYGTAPSRWEKRKRPTGRLKQSVKVKITRKSSGNDIMVAVYSKFKKKETDRWAKNNVWYARFVEYGTGPGKKGKKAYLHHPTKAYPTFHPGVKTGISPAFSEIETRIITFFQTFPFK